MWGYFLCFGIGLLITNVSRVGVILPAMYVVLLLTLVRFTLGGIFRSLFVFTVATLLGIWTFYPNLQAIEGFLLSEIIWLLVIFSISFALDKSIRSIFGVSLVEVFSGFFFQWFYDDKRLENALEKLSTKTKVKTDVFVLGDKEKKVYIVVPRFHFGPFGTIGSSRAPYLFSTVLGNVIVLHSLTNHDYDLASEEDVLNVARSVLEKEHGSKGFLKFAYKKFQYENAKAHVLYFDDASLIGLTREPEVTEDVKAEGEAILLSNVHRTIGNPVFYDEHNSSAEKITYFSPTSPEFREYLELVKRLKANLPKEAEMAYFKVLSLDPSIGGNGINVLLLKNDKQKIALVSIDGNGISKESLESLRKLFKKYRITPIITTTDSHENNDVAGIINEIVISPLDLFLIEEKLKNIEWKKGYFRHYWVENEVSILGSESSSKLLTLLSSSASFILSILLLGFIMNVLLLLSLT